MKTETLELKLQSLWSIFNEEHPLTLHEQTRTEAVATYNCLNLIYAIKTGRQYTPK